MGEASSYSWAPGSGKLRLQIAIALYSPYVLISSKLHSKSRDYVYKSVLFFFTILETSKDPGKKLMQSILIYFNDKNKK